MIGIHVAKVSHVLNAPNKNRKTMIEAITKDCGELTLGACQIFVQGPRNTKMSKMDYEKINLYTTKQKINLYVHTSYLSVGIFSVTSKNMSDKKSINAIESIRKQLDACDKLGAKGLVIHLTKRTPSEIAETMRILIPQIRKYSTPLIFEQPAKKPCGDLTYETPEKINNLTSVMAKEFPKYTNWGWCIDTCHLWSGGIELCNKKTTDKWLKALKYPKKISLFHLNGGSIDIFNTGKDKHIIPFSDEDDIWSADFINLDDEKEFNLDQIKKSSIWPITRFLKKNKIDIILEINRGSYKDAIFAITTLHNLTH